MVPHQSEVSLSHQTISKEKSGKSQGLKCGPPGTGQAHWRSATNPLHTYQIHKGPEVTPMVCFEYINTIY